MALVEKEWQDHAALIGRVTLAWNQNVHQMLRVFIHLTRIESPVADAIFFSPQSDKAQRNLIKRVAAAFEIDDRYLASLMKILKGLERVSSGRNLAAHVIFGISAFDPVTNQWGATVVPALTPPQDQRLEPNFAAQFRDVEQTLYALHRDLIMLTRCLIPAFDGASSAQAWRDALWDRFYTGAPARQRQSVERYNLVKRA